MKISIASNRGSNGFALIVTLSLMILLTVIAVGLLTLSSISLRSSNQSEAMAAARANARMALLLAIGELQKSTGPDQRVTSPADIAGDAAGLPLAAGAQPLNDKSINGVSKGLSGVQPGSRYWTGVWKNSNSTTPGLEIYSKTPSPTFVQWLVSGNESGGAPILPSDGIYSVNPSGAVADVTKAVILAGKNTVGTSPGGIDRHVVVPLVQVMGKDPSKRSGRFGWWVGDEGVKARINLDSTLADGTDASLTAQRRGWETVGGFDTYPVPPGASTSSIAKVTDLAQTALLVPAAVGVPLKSVFHSATADSRAVLADSLNGGTKIDLSAILSKGLPTNNPVSTILNYPVKGSNIIPTVGAPSIKAPRWDAVKDFRDRYDQLSGGSLIVKAATSNETAAIAPLITDFRILMGC